jgi:hypothetical protein
VKVAVYVVALAGVETECCWAPPSLQEPNVYVVPESVCGEGAFKVWLPPVQVKVWGAA